MLDLVTDEEIVQEVCERAIKLADLKTGPLRIFNDGGERAFTFNNWYFRLHRYVPEHWSFSGPKHGDVKMLVVHFAPNYSSTPFYYDMGRKKPGENPWQLDREGCESLILSLRHSMILDDLAGIPPDKPLKVDVDSDSF